MLLRFQKYQATGNDFIMVDGRSKDVMKDLNTELIAKLCDRRFGIGADGLIIIEDSDGYDFKMIYFNSDGRESTMCGNGGRCLVNYAISLGINGYREPAKTGVYRENSLQYKFEAPDGIHLAWAFEGNVKLKMQVHSYCHTRDQQIWMNSGSPHLIIWEGEDLWEKEVKMRGRRWRNHKDYEEMNGTNVNFVYEEKENHLWVRTYERGVEDETYSCGTGVTAAAYAHLKENRREGTVNIKTLGGELRIEVHQLGLPSEEVYLIGPAKFVFEGVINL
ncbi:MAG: diaminopimelate epimerase [Bacteroidia bacterium]|nr:diaminopimelate epimerase [Bacteroidia bacterium]